MNTWRNGYRQQYLDAILKLEGRGRLWQGCVECSSLQAEFRCEDCFGYAALCRACSVQKHRYEPLHWLQVSL